MLHSIHYIYKQEKLKNIMVIYVTVYFNTLIHLMEFINRHEEKLKSGILVMQLKKKLKE